MSGTYKATGINLKSIPLGESDRLLTILTREAGLVRAVAPGARKHKSTLRGRSNLFVINDLLIAKGRSLDKIIQAESLESFSGIAQDLGKLTASQYLSELAMYEALTEHPQEALFDLLQDALVRLNRHSASLALANLVRAVYQLLAYAGLAPQVFQCCVTQQRVIPDFQQPDWRVEFDAAAGGVVLRSPQPSMPSSLETSFFSGAMLTPTHADSPLYAESAQAPGRSGADPICRESSENLEGDRPIPIYRVNSFSSNSRASKRPFPRTIKLATQLTASELAVLQQLAQDDARYPDAQGLNPGQSPGANPVSQPSRDNEADDLFSANVSQTTLLAVERVLRHYAQYHLDQPIRSATLIDTCFLSPSLPTL